MADNYVQIRIKATDTAKPDLDSLRADLDELGSKVDTAKVDVNDDDAKRKLLEINAELAALNKRVANPKIDTAGAARAEARIEKLKGDFDDLIHKVDESNTKTSGHGLLSGLLFGAAGREGAAKQAEEAASKIKESVGGIVGLLRSLPGGGGAEGGGSATGMLGDLSGLAAGGGGIAAGLGAILVELDGLLSGFAAAGAGAGAFALLAVPAFDKVKTAFTNVTAAQQAYQKAQLTERMDPTKANAAAVAKALLGVKEAWKGLDPAERGAVQGIQQLEHSWQRMSKAFEPDAFKVFNEGLKIANQLLPLAKPFADTFATSLDGLLKQVSKFTGSSGFKDWVKQFHSLEGPAVTAIGRGIGQVVIAFGKLFTIMSKKDVVNSINIAFKIISGTLDALGFIIARIMLRWDQWVQAFDESRHAIGAALDWIHDHFRSEWNAIMAIVKTAIDYVKGTIKVALDLIHGNWAKAGQDLKALTHTIWHDVVNIIRTTLQTLPGQLFSFGMHIIDELADGIRSAAGGALSGAMNFVSGLISDFIPHSPAKKGALSGRGDPRLSGQRIAQMLAQGITEGSGAVDAAADRLTGGARFGGGRGANPGGLVVEIHAPSGAAAMLPPQFWTQLANGIRVRGGDPAMLQRKVAFR